MSPHESVPTTRAMETPVRPQLPSLDVLASAAKTLATIHSSTRISTSASTTSATTVTAATDNYCQFRNNSCANPRASKPNGERQAFCEFHLRQSSLHKRHWQRKQQTMLFRDPSRVPTALLRGLPQSITPRLPPTPAPRHQTTTTPKAVATTTALPRLRSHDVLRRALLMTVQHLPSPPQTPRSHSQPLPRILPPLRTLDRRSSSFESRSSDSSPRSPSGITASVSCAPYQTSHDNLIHYNSHGSW